MADVGADRLVHFTTDMIYGHTVTLPMTEDHPVAPLGEYGLSKLKTEELATDWRERGMRISLFRPRLIIGPGRLGILSKLFKLIDWNLPVPMIATRTSSSRCSTARKPRASPSRPGYRTRPTISARSIRRR
jgi:dTDP-glucose 4,6-dehydratase